MYIIFSAVIPVFLVIAIGMIVRRIGILPDNTGQAMGMFVVNVCMPCLLFYVMSKVTPEQFSQGTWWLATIASQLVLMAVGFLGDRLRGVPMGPSVISGLVACFNNAAFVGLPIVMALLPGNATALSVAGLCLVSTNAVAIIGQVSLEIWARRLKDAKPVHASFPHRIWAGVRRYLLSNAVLMATILGLFCALLGIELWAPIDRAVSLVGYTAPPVMLFALGFGLVDNVQRAMKAKDGMFLHQAWLLLCKLLLLPSVTWILLLWAGQSGVWLGVNVLMSATGCAVVTSVFAAIYHAGPEEAALSVVTSNAMSMGSLLGFIWALTQAGYLG